MRLIGSATVVVLTILTVSCTPTKQGVFFENDDYDDAARPWSHLDFENDPENFQFVIVTDRTGNHRQGVFAAILDKIDLLQPEFVMSVGDYVEGYIEDEAEIGLQWQEIDEIVADLDAPFFYVPGNHDHGNTQMAKAWKQRKGRTHYHFVYRNTLFIALHTEDPPPQSTPEREAAWRKMFELLNDSGAKALQRYMRNSDVLQPEFGQLGDVQTDYIVEAIKSNEQVRWTFLFMHRPIWHRTSRNNFTRVEEALKGRNYTMFAGHEHHYEYLRRHGQDYMQLSTTGGGWTFSAMKDVDIANDGMTEMDHITWVTMRDAEKGGPSFAHIVASGILSKDRVPDFVPGQSSVANSTTLSVSTRQLGNGVARAYRKQSFGPAWRESVIGHERPSQHLGQMVLRMSSWEAVGLRLNNITMGFVEVPCLEFERIQHSEVTTAAST